MATPYVQQQVWAQLTFAATVAAFAAGELAQAIKRRLGASRVDLPGEVAFRVVFIASILILPLAQTLAPVGVVEGAWMFVAGAAVGWFGLGLRWWAFRALGDYFTVTIRVSADQPVISRGPYRLLRHPGYTGLLAAMLGCGLMLGNWIGACACVLLLLPALVHRIRKEESALADTLRDAYLDYARDRARLVPHVW